MGVKGSKVISLSDILREVDPEEAYIRYCPVKFTLDKPFKNPIRGEREASFIIGNNDGQIKHHDFADSYFHGNFVDFVMQKENCDLRTAIAIIAKDFNLTNIRYETTSRNCKIITTLPKENKVGDVLIQIVSKAYTRGDLAYWESFGINQKTLENEKIYSIKELYINRRKVNIPIQELAFAYEYSFKGEEKKFFKIYRPFSKTSKWKSNVPLILLDRSFNTMGSNGRRLIITKSKKDKMVLNSIFTDVVSVQNESLAAISDELIELASQYEEVYLNYDSDDPGVKNSIMVTEKFGWKHFNVPKKFMPIKDFADLRRDYGQEELIKYFKSINMLC